MADTTVLRKDQLEISLHNEKKLIKEGTIKDDNPLDLSEPFRELCSACRRGDLKVCQEKITEGVNVNARDLYDYTPLILVSATRSTILCIIHFLYRFHPCLNNISNRYISSDRPVYADTMKSRNYYLNQAHYVSEIHFKEKGNFDLKLPFNHSEAK
jgi:ankyrin repeat protein